MRKFQQIDSYGRPFIAASKGKVLKGYWIGFGYVEHCLVDQYGMVFISGDSMWKLGGWSNRQHNQHFQLKVFPHPVERGNEWNNSSWRWEDWYERNWLCDSWAWMYSKASASKYDCEKTIAA